MNIHLRPSMRLIGLFLLLPLAVAVPVFGQTAAPSPRAALESSDSNVVQEESAAKKIGTQTGVEAQQSLTKADQERIKFLETKIRGFKMFEDSVAEQNPDNVPAAVVEKRKLLELELAEIKSKGAKSTKRMTKSDQERVDFLEEEIRGFEMFEASMAEMNPDFEPTAVIKKRKAFEVELASIKQKYSSSSGETSSETTDDAERSHQVEILSSEIQGVAYDWGERVRTRSSALGTYVYQWEGGGVYLVMKDGTAVFNPEAPPSDLGLEQFKRKNPDSIKRLSYLELKKEDIYPPRERGYTLDIYVERPSTSVGLSSTTSSWRELRLSKSGRFETGKTALVASNLNPADSTYGAEGQSNYVTSSDKDGTFTGGNAVLMTGTGTALARRGTGKRGSNSGTYLIDGNTIELRYDNGEIVRSLFGTDGKENVVMGHTNYWTPKTK